MHQGEECALPWRGAGSTKPLARMAPSAPRAASLEVERAPTTTARPSLVLTHTDTCRVSNDNLGERGERKVESPATKPRRTSHKDEPPRRQGSNLNDPTYDREATSIQRGTVLGLPLRALRLELRTIIEPVEVYNWRATAQHAGRGCKQGS